ncbi:hypothetical protein CARUB_v10021143mg [Capsella rubella]|uniref:Uncharacterized protein n=1 Tax=Capsella rubella TaxID=81985 RepID=R0GJE9_9BRAS|nr:uncharacterized protein LOC17896377 [Capsella rubella]EOA35886.1 hypothetical protein CARUB_v10021143mg [Capsella rubella]
MADSEDVNNSHGNNKFPFQRYRVKFRRHKLRRLRDKVKAEPSCEDQTMQDIKESLALEVAKEEASKDDHDTAFMDVIMGGKTSVLEGGEDTEQANVGGNGSGMCTVPTSEMEWLKKCDGNNTKGQSYP